MSAIVLGSHILPAPVGMSTGQAAVHDPHIIHLLLSISAWLSTILMALVGQTISQVPQKTQSPSVDTASSPEGDNGRGAADHRLVGHRNGRCTAVGEQFCTAGLTRHRSTYSPPGSA